MRDLILTMRVPGNKAARYKVLNWIAVEWGAYANSKPSNSIEMGDKWMRESGIGQDSEWRRQITQYWDRAHVLGLNTPAGRQALMKSITTLVDCAAAMIRVHGTPPPAGYPSGDIRELRGIHES